jgi:hypothetical protein
MKPRTTFLLVLEGLSLRLVSAPYTFPFPGGLWSEYVYYPGERSSALSIDGTKYYYSIWNPINTGAVLYTYDLKKNKVTSVCCRATFHVNFIANAML